MKEKLNVITGFEVVSVLFAAFPRAERHDSRSLNQLSA